MVVRVLEVEGSGGDEDDDPVPEVGAVGDFAEVDDGVVGERVFDDAVFGGFDRDDECGGDEGGGDAALDGVEVDG